jgi:sulfur carrier protein
LVNTNVGKSCLDLVIQNYLSTVYSKYFKNMITIKVNQENHQFSETLALAELIRFLEIKTNGIAVAINGSVVKKNDWSLRLLQNSDEVLIIKSTQGG